MNIDIMSLVIFVSGAFILIYGIFFAPTEEEEKMIVSSMDMSGMDIMLKRLDNKLADSDKMLLELDKFSEYVTSEMQEKYKEMMFLYQMIDEKEKALQKEAEEAKEIRIKAELMKKEAEEIKQREKEKLMEIEQRRLEREREDTARNSVKAFYTSTQGNMKEGIYDPRLNNTQVSINQSAKSSFDDVVYMYESGRNIEDIAKALGKGKGEVRLMLDLMGKEG